MISSSTPRQSWWSVLIQWLLVLWAVSLVFYFEIREGLIRWSWLFEPASGAANFFRDRGLPDPRLERPPAADAPIAPYVEILKNALGPYDIQWGNAPWKELLIALAMLGAYTLLGWLLLAGFRVFIPVIARLCLAFTVGCGAAGIGGELLGMAHQLNRPSVSLLWAGLFGLGLIIWGQAFARRDNVQTISADTQLTWAEQRLRARDWFASTWPWPRSFGGNLLWAIYAALFTLISFVVLLHAIGEPVSYWDSLILYVGYARMMYLEGGFPLKIVGQVGIGLGANYPHLYEVLTAQTAALAGYWSDSFAQLLPPVAVTAALVLVYYSVLDLSRNRLIAMSAALLVRAVPYGLSYSQFASNYSVAILFTAAFIYMAIRLVRDGLPGYRHLMLLLAAGAVHINYLMWGLWPVAALAIIMAHWRYHPIDIHDPRWAQADPGTPLPVYPPEFMSRHYRPSVWRLFTRGEFWMGLILALMLASPWYIRNTLLTGNPVYAFYSNVFPSKNVNPAVMKSAEHEWMLNGDGLGNVGHTLGEKVAGSWLYFVTGNQHWKLAPVFMALVVPGFLLWALWWLGRAVSGRRKSLSAEASAGPDALVFRSIAAVAALFLLLWFYAYVVADFYLYQIIIVLPLFGIFIGCVFMYCRGRGARAVLYSLTLLIAIAPGLVMGIMGFKLKKTGIYDNMPMPQFAVTALRKLFMNQGTYYRMEYGGDMDMIADLNNTLPAGTVILTHENRHLLLKPTLKIVHLDDWETQAAYGKPVADRMRILDSLGVKYYLFVPNETRHIANSWLGMEELIRDGYYKKDMDTSSPDSGSEDYPLTVTPRDMNVLYVRTDKPVTASLTD
jgi:hypothetical protein